MSYCATPYNRDARLSVTDIYSVQRAYGRRAPGAVVAFDGRCLDINGGGGANGNWAQTFDCLGTNTAQQNQRWYWQWWDAKLGMWDFPRVLDISNNSTANAAAVQSWDWNSSAAQQWRFENTQIQSLGGLCLDLPLSDTTNNNQQIWLWPCHGNATTTTTRSEQVGTGASPFSRGWADPAEQNRWRLPVPENQMFTFQPDGHIRMTGAGFLPQNKCLGLKFGGTANGTPLTVQTCANVSHQLFRLGGVGTITLQSNTNVCLEVGLGDFNTFDGVSGQYKLQAWACNGLLKQRFNFYGQIRASANRCLDVGGWERTNGGRAWSWTCDPLSAMSTKQGWQFYW